MLSEISRINIGRTSSFAFLQRICDMNFLQYVCATVCRAILNIVNIRLLHEWWLTIVGIRILFLKIKFLHDRNLPWCLSVLRVRSAGRQWNPRKTPSCYLNRLLGRRQMITWFSLTAQESKVSDLFLMWMYIYFWNTMLTIFCFIVLIFVCETLIQYSLNSILFSSLKYNCLRSSRYIIFEQCFVSLAFPRPFLLVCAPYLL